MNQKKKEKKVRKKKRFSGPVNGQRLALPVPTRVRSSPDVSEQRCCGSEVQ